MNEFSPRRADEVRVGDLVMAGRACGVLRRRDVDDGVLLELVGGAVLECSPGSTLRVARPSRVIDHDAAELVHSTSTSSPAAAVHTTSSPASIAARRAARSRHPSARRR